MSQKSYRNLTVRCSRPLYSSQPTHPHPHPTTNRQQKHRPGNQGALPQNPDSMPPPHTHTSTHQGHPPQQTTTTTTAAAAHHKQACFLHQHNQPTPHNSARPASRSFRARHPLQAGPDHTGPDKTNNQKRRRRQTAPHKPILRKEVIQPHLPVRLPCYDFVPITSPTFDRSP